MMSRLGAMHARAHGQAKAGAVADASNRNQIIVSVDPQGVPKVGGAYVLGTVDERRAIDLQADDADWWAEVGTEPAEVER